MPWARTASSCPAAAAAISSRSSARLGVPVVRGPEELVDLPQFFGKSAAARDLSRYDTLIFAEIVEAPQLSVAGIEARARELAASGADVIDLGCLPQTPFPHLSEAVTHLKSLGFKVSVDSLEPDELLRGGRAGADYLLSLREDTLWIADEVAATPILIPREPGDLASLERAIDALERKRRAYLADPVLDPIHFGFTDSLARYHALRRARPQAPIMMGIGNLTELTYADTMGMNALLFGIASELGIAAVLVVQVSEHARSVVREADIARRIMFAARADHALPKNYSQAMLALHEKRPFTHTPAEIAELAAGVRDPNFRVMLSEARRACVQSRRAPLCGRSLRLLAACPSWRTTLRMPSTWAWSWRARRSPGSSASATRRTRSCAGALPSRLGQENLLEQKAAGTTLGHRRRAAQAGSRMIWEAVVTSVSSAGQVHIAPMGFREVDGRVVLAPFRPSTTLDNLLATRCAAVNLSDDVRVFAGCLTGRREWPTLPCEQIGCVRLDGALAHRELRLARVEQDEQRPRLHFDVVLERTHAPFRGFNRAQAAVVEAAILVSRLHMLPPEKIDREMNYLAIAIEKTAGPREREAWSWLVERIEQFRSGKRETA